MYKILFPYMARWYAVNWTRYHSLLSVLAELGHQVYVMQPPPLESKETNFLEINKFEQKNIFISDVKLNTKLWNTKFPFDKLFKKAYYSLAAKRSAEELISRHSIDVLLLYNIPQFRFISVKKIKKVFDYADDYVDMLRIELGRFDNKLARYIAGKMLKRMMKQSDITMCVSYELAKNAIGNVHVIPNGVKQKPITDDSVLPDNFDKSYRGIVGFVGSFEYFIDFDLILTAATKMRDIGFLLVGTGRDFAKVADFVDKNSLSNVKLTGGVPHSDVFRYVKKMDVCLNIFKPIPVSHRACPIKLFEYLSMKKPVISTRLHELQHIDKGFLYYADTYEQFIHQVNYILDKANQDEISKKIDVSYIYTMQNFTWENIADKFISLLDGVN